MDAYATVAEGEGTPPPALRFEGRWPSFFGIQIVNLLLTIVTLGIYRFWGKTRYRRYLWSETRLGDEPLEYRGTGLELLIGAILAVLLIGVPFALAGLVLPALVGEGGAGLLLAQLLITVALLYLIGVGIYRSWRYILSRTAWRGIRGGMREGGWRFGLVNLGLLLAQFFSLGLATPWASVRRWNALVGDMSLGSLPLASAARARRIYPRFLLAWFGLFVVGALVAAAVAAAGVSAVFDPATPPAPNVLIGIVLGLYAALFLFFFFGALIFAQYHAAYLRETYGATTIGGETRLACAVTTGDVIRYYLGNFALVMLTLGIGVLLLPFRRYAFHARRIVLEGRFDEERMLQTSLAGPRQGEGIADAFDLSPF